MKINCGMSLKALDLADAETARAWRNDYQIWQWTRQSDLISDLEQAAWYRRQSNDPTISMYKIVVQANKAEEMVGVCGLTSIDRMNRRAEFSLYIAPAEQKKGYGRQALKLLFDHGFKNLGLNQIWGETFAGNPAIKLFAELGMKLDGMRRDFYWKDGRFLSAHLISILASEWNQKHDSSTVDKPADPLPGGAPSQRCDQAQGVPPGGLGGAAKEAEVVEAPTPLRKPRVQRPAP